MVCCVIAQLVKVIKGIETKSEKGESKKFAIYNQPSWANAPNRIY
jgi:hypothetical protein